MPHEIKASIQRHGSQENTLKDPTYVWCILGDRRVLVHPPAPSVTQHRLNEYLLTCFGATRKKIHRNTMSEKKTQSVASIVLCPGIVTQPWSMPLHLKVVVYRCDGSPRFSCKLLEGSSVWWLSRWYVWWQTGQSSNIGLTAIHLQEFID